MLTESFIASVRTGTKSAAHSSLPKDAAVFLHDFQPRPQLKGILKKSSTNQNCLAVTDSHIFAAQSNAAIINVYNREKGNQETIATFKIRVTSLARIGPADGAAILALGTEGGGLMLWELCTGRIVTTDPSHLQAVTCLAVDPTNSFLLSGSTDSSIQVWSIPGLLSFTDPGFGDASEAGRMSPRLHFSSHRAAVTSIVTGHSHTNVDFAISGSEDKTCLVWNYRSGELLHTFLLPETPLCIAIEPADRGFCAGLPDGSIQSVDFAKAGGSVHLLYDKRLSETPTQAAESDRRRAENSEGNALALAYSYDGADILSGHEDGKVFAWDVSQKRQPEKIADLGQPVSNLLVVPPSGFPRQKVDPAGVRALTVVKPRFDAFPHTGGSGLSVSQNYNFTAVFTKELSLPQFTDAEGFDTLMRDFNDATRDESFPPNLLQAAIAELAGSATSIHSSDTAVEADSEDGSMQQELTRLKFKLKMAEAQKQKFAEKLVEANEEIEKRDKLARTKQRAKSVRREKIARKNEQRRRADMGANGRDQSRQDASLEEELSEDTDELMNNI